MHKALRTVPCKVVLYKHLLLLLIFVCLKKCSYFFSFLNDSSVKHEILCWPFLPSAFSRYDSTVFLHLLFRSLLPLWLTFLSQNLLSDLLLRFFSLHLMSCGFTLECPCVNWISFFKLQSLCALWVGSTASDLKNSLNQSGFYKIGVSFFLT